MTPDQRHAQILKVRALTAGNQGEAEAKLLDQDLRLNTLLSGSTGTMVDPVTLAVDSPEFLALQTILYHRQILSTTSFVGTTITIVQDLTARPLIVLLRTPLGEAKDGRAKSLLQALLLGVSPEMLAGYYGTKVRVIIDPSQQSSTPLTLMQRSQRGNRKTKRQSLTMASMPTAILPRPKP